MAQLEIKDIKYGVIVIDKRAREANPDGETEILHFCGFGEKPTSVDIDMVFDELANTPEFGVADIMEFIEIYDAPDYIVEQYKEELLNGTITTANTTDDGKDISSAPAGVPD